MFTVILANLFLAFILALIVLIVLSGIETIYLGLKEYYLEYKENKKINII